MISYPPLVFFMKPTLLVALFVTSFSFLARAQVNTGSIVVFELTNQRDRFIAAADSRAVFKSKLAEDNHCKIAGFREQFVFAITGAASYPSGVRDRAPSWDGIKEAGKVIRLHGLNKPQSAETRVNTVADMWGRKLKNDWQDLYRWHRDIVEESAKRGKGTLTTGIFATAVNGEIAVAVRSIDLTKEKVVVAAPKDKCEIGLCASGLTDIFKEYVDKASQRAKDEAELWSLSQRPDTEMRWLIRLVDLTIEYDLTHQVGGKIDVIELWKDGSIHWIQRKPECPEKQN